MLKRLMDIAGGLVGEYAEYIAGLSDRKVIMQIEDDKSVSKAMYALLDISKIKKIGWNPIYSVRDALNKTFLIYKDIRRIYLKI